MILTDVKNSRSELIDNTNQSTSKNTIKIIKKNKNKNKSKTKATNRGGQGLREAL